MVGLQTGLLLCSGRLNVWLSVVFCIGMPVRMLGVRYGLVGSFGPLLADFSTINRM